MHTGTWDLLGTQSSWLVTEDSAREGIAHRDSTAKTILASFLYVVPTYNMLINHKIQIRLFKA